MRIKKITIQDYGPIKNLTITPEIFETVIAGFTGIKMLPLLDIGEKPPGNIT